MIHDGQLVASGGATCTGGTGTGTNADPYVNSTSCTLPSNSSIFVKPFSFYTVQAADYGAPNHVLKDNVDLTWLDTCTSGDGNCPVGDQHATTGSQQRVAFTPAIAASIKGNGTTVVPAGTSVFDTATLSSASPDAGGTVTYAVYTDNTCTTLAGSQPVPATVTVTNAVVPPSGGVVLPPGSYFFQA